MAKATWVGLGTVIARTTKRLGVTPCSGCKKRQKALDRIVPKIWKLPPEPKWMR